MTTDELLHKFQQALEDSPMALLATVTADGFPAMRYMTPATIPGRVGYLYAITAAAFPKVNDLRQQDFLVPGEDRFGRRPPLQVGAFGRTRARPRNVLEAER